MIARIPPEGRAILAQVAYRHRIPIAALVSQSHSPYLTPPRREVSARLRKLGWSLPRIGRLLGGRHHTSVLYYLRDASTVAPEVPTGPDYSGEWAI